MRQSLSFLSLCKIWKVFKIFEEKSVTYVNIFFVIIVIKMLHFYINNITTISIANKTSWKVYLDAKFHFNNKLYKRFRILIFFRYWKRCFGADSGRWWAFSTLWKIRFGKSTMKIKISEILLFFDLTFHSYLFYFYVISISC